MIRSFVTTARRVRSRALFESDESGFTVVEVVVSIALVTIVMTSLAAFFVTSAGVIDNQSQRQTASQLATDAIGTARAQTAGGVVTQRGKGASQTAWNRALADGSPYPGVAAYLTKVKMAYDLSAPAGSGADAPLSTSGKTVRIDNTAFTQNWFLGDCYAATTNGACAKSPSTSHPTHYVQVVVDVTWTGMRCSPTCSYVSATRFSTSPDPLFDAGQSATKPKITNPGNQVSDAGSPITALALASTGGTAPLTWTALGLPDGLSLDTSTSPVTIKGTPSTSTSAPAKVTLTLTDAFGFTSTAAFTWTIAPKLTLTNKPGNQSSSVGDTVSLSTGASGGTGSPKFTISGQPDGLSINSTTGAISGKPTTAVSGKSVTVTVTDGANGTDSVTFTWTVTTSRLSITNPTSDGSCNIPQGTVIPPGYANLSTLGITATGGVAPYTWTATDLPTGVSIDGNGNITGTATNGFRYVTTLTATDATGKNTASTRLICYVTGGIAVTGLPDISTKVGQIPTINPSSISVTHNGSPVSSITGFSIDKTPPGVTVDGYGNITHGPSTPGVYVTRITVSGSYSDDSGTHQGTAVAMFVWTVTA